MKEKSVAKRSAVVFSQIHVTSDYQQDSTVDRFLRINRPIFQFESDWIFWIGCPGKEAILEVFGVLERFHCGGRRWLGSFSVRKDRRRIVELVNHVRRGCEHVVELLQKRPSNRQGRGGRGSGGSWRRRRAHLARMVVLGVSRVLWIF